MQVLVLAVDVQQRGLTGRLRVGDVIGRLRILDRRQQDVDRPGR
jgi:hypothetical protein